MMLRYAALWVIFFSARHDLGVFLRVSLKGDGRFDVCD